MSTIAIIPARGGSKRVPKKNIRDFQGMPLIAWSIRAAQHCDMIEEVFVSTDDKTIGDIAISYGAKVLWRPDSLSSDESSTFDVLKYIYYEQLLCNMDLMVVLQPTSPLREKNLISNGIKTLLNTNTDRIMEINKLKLFTGKVFNGTWTGDYPEETRSQDLPTSCIPSGRLYVYKCSSTIEKNLPEGRETKVIEGSYERNINIDYEDDFDKLEFIYSKYKDLYKHLLIPKKENEN